MPDMTRVRLLARRGNTGSFFVVDEFDPTEDKDRNDGSGTDTSLYSASSQTYHFRNDTLGATVPNQTIDNLITSHSKLRARLLWGIGLCTRTTPKVELILLQR